MVKQSAGILLYKMHGKSLEVFLVHPGGPFWKNKDIGAWTIPKGEFNDSEDALNAAVREFKEETGYDISGEFITLTPIVQKNGKKVFAFALQHDIDAGKIVSNTFSIEWPPKSGKQKQFPEVDRGQWFEAADAKLKINERQAQLIDELQSIL